MTNEEYCEQWFEKYRNEVTRKAISDLWNMATKIEREACAKVAEDFDFNQRPEIDPPRGLPRYVAQSILARK